MAANDRRPSLLVPVVVAVAIVVVGGALLRFVVGTLFAAVRLLAVVLVAGVVIALVLRRSDR